MEAACLNWQLQMVPLLGQSRQLDWPGGGKPLFSRSSKEQAGVVFQFSLEQVDLGTDAGLCAAAWVTVLAVRLCYKKRSLCTKRSIRNTRSLPCSLALHVVIGELLQDRLPRLSSGVRLLWLLCVCPCAPAHVLLQRGDHGLRGAADALAYGVM